MFRFFFNSTIILSEFLLILLVLQYLLSFFYYNLYYKKLSNQLKARPRGGKCCVFRYDELLSSQRNYKKER